MLTALITGVSGQDGAYLSRLLLHKGYRVIGTVKAGSAGVPPRLAELRVGAEVELIHLDLGDQAGLTRRLEALRPDEIYNLAAPSSVAKSFGEPVATAETAALAPARILDALRVALPAARFYQASTSEMFGLVERPQEAQGEGTRFHPRSPYGVAKAYAHWLTINYRESYGLFAVSGILFNHESPLRGRDFVTRQITLGLAEVKHGRRERLRIGNLAARRDWGFAGDHVDGMWRMLQSAAPADYVLATGRSHSVRQFVELAAAGLGLDLAWRGAGAEEQGIDRRSGKVLVEIDRGFRRPSDIPELVGDAGKAMAALGWAPRVDFAGLVAMMAEADERRVRDGGPLSF